MMQTKNEMLESRTEAVSRDALVRAALQEITQNYREASLSNVYTVCKKLIKTSADIV